MQDLITVAVAVYNTEKYLRRCVDSILKQSYSNFEIILVDDGSTDGSPSICDEYAEREEKVSVYHKENGGLSSARNTGIENARGVYLTFVDSDDYIAENYLQTLHANLVSTKAHVAVCGYYKDKGNGVISRNTAGKRSLFTYEKAMEYLFCENSFGAYSWNKMFRMDIIRENQVYFDLELRMTQDLVWACQYMKCCKRISYDPTPVYYYCFNEDSVCRKARSTGVFNRKGLITLVAHERAGEIIKNDSKRVIKSYQGRCVCTYMRLLVNLYYSNNTEKDLVKLGRDGIRKNLWAFLTRPFYGIADRGGAVMMAISPRFFFSVYGVLNKLFGIEIG